MTESHRVTVTEAPEGEVALPGTIRARRRWPAGARLVVEERADGVLLRPEAPAKPLFKPTTVDEVFGSLRKYYDGPPISVEDMDKGIEELFRSEWGRRFDPR